MKNSINWGNWLLLIFFIVLMCVNLAEHDYVFACICGFLAIFNMFIILVLYERRIMCEQDEQKAREEKIIEMLKGK